MGYQMKNPESVIETKKFYEKCLEQIDNEYKAKILDAEKEAAINKERIAQERRQSDIKAQMEDFAFQQKVYLDALIEAGFDEEFARAIFMKSVNGVPYVYRGVDFSLGLGGQMV